MEVILILHHITEIKQFPVLCTEKRVCSYVVSMNIIYALAYFKAKHTPEIDNNHDWQNAHKLIGI